MTRVMRTVSAAIFRVRKPGVVRIVRELEARQWWPRQKLAELEDRRTRDLATFAATKISYYRDLFERHGVVPETMVLPDDWERLPILTREDLRTHSEDLYSNEPVRGVPLVMSSGGSTGEPVSFLVEQVQFDVAEAILALAFSWSGWRFGEPALSLWGGKANLSPSSGLRERLKTKLSGNVTLPVYAYDESAMAFWWQTMERYRPTVIYAYASVAADFARWLLAERKRPSGVKGVFCSAEMLLPEFRTTIEEAFGCKVFNQYGSRETPAVACECEAGNLHVFSDLNRVEYAGPTEDGDGASRILITPLYRRAQPLIRYDLGDLARPAAADCPCGRGYPLMEGIAGRQCDFFLAPNGKKIYPTFFVRQLYGRDWIRQYQFRQESPGQVQLLLELVDAGTGRDRVGVLVAELLPSLRSLMGHEVELVARVVSSIPRTKVGKHRFVINQMGID
ncbi:MAG TPA: AMP-binding protein [Candidatus Polarisedimenticolaceae bacterium]|nr:AMP-binding protein [Candidatus Polarisedimenticolaceae bacterium]